MTYYSNDQTIDSDSQRPHFGLKKIRSKRLSQLEDKPYTYFDDCDDALSERFTETGVYRIKPKASLRPFRVWCDMEPDGGGWIVIQARFDGLVDFLEPGRNIEMDSAVSIANFGSVTIIFIRLTGNNDYELKIATEDEKYRLNISNFTGIGGINNALSSHNGLMFSFKDNDNDNWPLNCAEFAHGAWWYHSCYSSNLNGLRMSILIIQLKIGIFQSELVDHRIIEL